VSGVKRPFTEQFAAGPVTFLMQVQETKVGLKLSPELFRAPASAKK
jgi:hypothetical protein